MGQNDNCDIIIMTRGIHKYIRYCWIVGDKVLPFFLPSGCVSNAFCFKLSRIFFIVLNPKE